MFRSGRPRHTAATILGVTLDACPVPPSEEPSPLPVLADSNGETSALGQCDAPPHPYSNCCRTTRSGSLGGEETTGRCYFPVGNATIAPWLPSEQTSIAEIEFVEGNSHQELEYNKECLMH